MLSSLLFLAGGFVILVKGADLLVDGAVMVAKKFHVSALIIGLTIVAFGTSSPELAVNILSALSPETSDIGLGNIVGSNIFNIGLIVGVAALIAPLAVKKIIITREIPFMFLATVVLWVLASDKQLQNSAANFLSAGDGVILLTFFIIFLYYLATSVFQQRESALEEEFAKEYQKRRDVSLAKGLLWVGLGLAGVMLGAKLVVDSAVTLASAIGISELLIGLTIVAIGTSLPELATSVVAAFKKEADIAVGNIVGSNIFNIFFILGVNATISPIPIKTPAFFDTYVMIAFSALLFVVSFTGKKINRAEGLMMFATYIGYVTFIILRG